MATSQTRIRKAATPKAAKAPVAGSKSAAAKKAPAKKVAPGKVPAKKAPAKPAVAKKAAVAKSAIAAKQPARKAAPATSKIATSKKALAKAGPVKALGKAKPKVAKVLDGFERLRKLVLDACDDLKAKDITEIDVRGKSSVADLLVVASGTSSRHVKSIADEVVKKAKQAGNPPIGVEGQREAEWVLVDLGDVIVHVMLPRTREFYALERLWSVGDRDGGFGDRS